MFEKEAEEYKDNTRIKDKNTYVGFPNERISELQDFEGNYIDISERIIKAFQDGAEFGYNKANEWHEIERKISPKREISKKYMPKSEEKVLLKYHFYDNDEIHISDGYYDAYDFQFHIANNPKFRIVCVIAWKEIVLPKESE